MRFKEIGNSIINIQQVRRIQFSNKGTGKEAKITWANGDVDHFEGLTEDERSYLRYGLQYDNSVIMPAPPGYKLLNLTDGELDRSDVVAFKISNTGGEPEDVYVHPITATEDHQCAGTTALLCPDGTCYRWQNATYQNEEKFLAVALEETGEEK